MAATGDFYSILRVAPGDEDSAIRVAYLSLMRRYHPDVNSSAEAAARATAINEAYACLRDPFERAAYDRQRLAWQAMRSAAEAPAPVRPQRPARRAQHAYIVEEEAEPRPSWWKPAGLGLATLLTIILFAITSATPPAVASAPEAVVIVKTGAGVHALR